MEAVVDSITTLDNKVSLPVSVDYTTKAENRREHGRIVYEACESNCKNCYKNKELCTPYIEVGQINIFPFVRKCKRCIAQG